MRRRSASTRATPSRSASGCREPRHRQRPYPACPGRDPWRSCPCRLVLAGVLAGLVAAGPLARVGDGRAVGGDLRLATCGLGEVAHRRGVHGGVVAVPHVVRPGGAQAVGCRTRRIGSDTLPLDGRLRGGRGGRRRHGYPIGTGLREVDGDGHGGRCEAESDSAGSGGRLGAEKSGEHEGPPGGSGDALGRGEGGSVCRQGLGETFKFARAGLGIQSRQQFVHGGIHLAGRHVVEGGALVIGTPPLGASPDHRSHVVR